MTHTLADGGYNLGFDDGLANGAARERARIAAWLRRQYKGRLQSPLFLADAIEAGEHDQ